MLVHIAISKCLHSLVSWSIHIFSACLLHAKKRQEEENTYDLLDYCVHAHTDARQLASPGSHRSSVTGSGNAQEKEVTLRTHVNSIYVCISTCTLYALHVCMYLYCDSHSYTVYWWSRIEPWLSSKICLVTIPRYTCKYNKHILNSNRNK